MFTGNVPAVVRFECRRALTVSRLLWWVGLTCFPVFILAMVQLAIAAARRHMGSGPPIEVITLLFFGLIPMLVSMLGTLLWTAPSISAELERKSWVYLAVRPNGGSAVLLGKFVAALFWVIPSAIVGLTLAIPIAHFGNGWSLGETWQIWWTMARLACLSCPAYAAVYLVIGVLHPKRAMVIAFAYTIVFELLVSFVPAVINKLTVQYRIQALLGNWADLNRAIAGNQFGGLALLDTSSSGWHIAVLVGYTLTLLLVAVLLLRWREFAVANEADV